MSVNNNIECQMNINKVAQPITDNSNSSPTLRTQMRSTSNNARLINNRKSTPVISSLNNNNNNTSNVLDCNNMYMNNSNNIPIQHHVNKTSAKRENAMGKLTVFLLLPISKTCDSIPCPSYLSTKLLLIIDEII